MDQRPPPRCGPGPARPGPARPGPRGGSACLGALLGAAVLAVAGCSGSNLKNDGYADGVVSYEVHGPGAGWREVQVENTNVAWIHDATAAALMVNSHCQGVEDAPLDVLTRHLTFGMDEREVLSEQRLEKSRREALQTDLKARIDGVTRRFRILVLKKDGCVYDIVLSAPPEQFEAVLPGYDRVVERFDVKPRPDRS